MGTCKKLAALINFLLNGNREESEPWLADEHLKYDYVETFFWPVNALTKFTQGEMRRSLRPSKGSSNPTVASDTKFTNRLTAVQGA